MAWEWDQDLAWADQVAWDLEDRAWDQEEWGPAWVLTAQGRIWDKAWEDLAWVQEWEAPMAVETWA